MRTWRRASIAGRSFALAVVLLIVGAALAFAVLAVDARADAEAEAAQRSLDLSQTLAASPTIRDALATAHAEFAADRDAAIALASAVLQPYALDILEATELDFVTIMNVDGTRYTHPNPDEIGATFLGTIAPAVEGGVVTEIYEGTLGPSVRAVVPVVADGEVVGLVASGVTIARVTEVVLERLWQVALVLVVAVSLAALAAWLVARRLRAVTGGHDPEALARLFATHEAALHSVDDGLVLVRAERIEVMNDPARALLGIAAHPPLDVADHAVPEAARHVLLGSERSALVGRRSLVIDRAQTRVLGAAASMLTIRDRTAVRRMAGELDAVRTMTRALRSQTHEFGNRLHTIATLIELGETQRALELAASERDVGQRLTDRVVGAIDEPVIAALLLGKAAEAHERAIELHVETHLEPGTQGFEPVDIVTILGNLVDNAIDAAAQTAVDGVSGWVEVYLAPDDDGTVVMQVTDSGAGVQPADAKRIFRTGWTTKDASEPRGFGLPLVRETVTRLGGTVEVDRAETGGAVFTVRLPLPGDAPLTGAHPVVAAPGTERS